MQCCFFLPCSAVRCSVSKVECFLRDMPPKRRVPCPTALTPLPRQGSSRRWLRVAVCTYSYGQSAPCLVQDEYLAGRADELDQTERPHAVLVMSKDAMQWAGQRGAAPIASGDCGSCSRRRQQQTRGPLAADVYPRRCSLGGAAFPTLLLGQ